MINPTARTVITAYCAASGRAHGQTPLAGQLTPPTHTLRQKPKTSALQQGRPVVPQAVQTGDTQSLHTPAEQVPPEQQGWPNPPHVVGAVQAPLRQTWPTAVQSEQMPPDAPQAVLVVPATQVPL